MRGLADWKKKYWDRFQQIGLPCRGQEAFQYLSYPLPSLPPPASLPALWQEPISCLSECRCVFVDGFFSPALSRLPSQVVALSLEEAAHTYGVFLQNRLSRHLKEEMDPFAALNGAQFGSGLFLYSPPRFIWEETLEIHHLSTGSQMASPRLHIYLGEGSELRAIQRNSSLHSQVFYNSFLDVALDEKSHFTLYDAQNFSHESYAFQSIRASQKKESFFKVVSLTQGAALSRTSFKTQLLEENSEAFLLGLSHLKASAQNHIHTLVEHAAPHTRSRQHFKGVLYDQSRSSFEGKILVRPVAQKTEAYQLCAHLLLGSQAEVNAKPNLEIFADDVKASHGATISEIQEEDLFYLRSRGLSVEEASRWLVLGFSREILDAIPVAELKQSFEAV